MLGGRYTPPRELSCWGFQGSPTSSALVAVMLSLAAGPGLLLAQPSRLWFRGYLVYEVIGKSSVVSPGTGSLAL